MCECFPELQTYTRTLNKLFHDQRFRTHPKNKKKALRINKKIKTITELLARKLKRNAGLKSKYLKLIELYKKVLAQTRKARMKFILFTSWGKNI